MKEGPDIARLGMLLGDPARANILNALMDGRALTASELAAIAGVGLPTASSHLSQLESGGLLSQAKQGRHRYYQIADQDVGAMLEQFMSFALSLGHRRTRTGPKDPALRQARVCYNHLAGEKGVVLFESFSKRRLLRFDAGEPFLTAKGRDVVTRFGIDVAALENLRRPLCRCCLDWSERRHHLAGSVGQALLERMFDLGWAKRERGSRAVAFSPMGQARFKAFLTAGPSSA
jgi:DNA-binding transcriptional ArsR family regulator